MATSGLVRREAQDLMLGALGADERVLVVGATGWFGTTVLALLESSDLPIHAIASRSRSISIGSRMWDVSVWDEEYVTAFRPTVILNFAFLTRDKEASLGPVGYARALEDLNQRLESMAQLPSVRALLTVSSGAAIHVPEGDDLPIGTYGEAKRMEESLALSMISPSRAVVVARAWSLSGTLVQRPRDYAFSDLVLQAREGVIRVNAPCEVWRRYCGVDDYVAVCTRALMEQRSGIIDSGGPDVELRDLARLVAERFPGGRPEVVAATVTEPARRYMSDDSTWREACTAADFVPATLAQQIDLVQGGLP